MEVTRTAVAKVLHVVMLELCLSNGLHHRPWARVRVRECLPREAWSAPVGIHDFGHGVDCRSENATGKRNRKEEQDAREEQGWTKERLQSCLRGPYCSRW